MLKQITRLFLPRESQLTKFKDFYWREAPTWFLTEDERNAFNQFSRCIHCGTCELDCYMLKEQENLRFKPSWVALTVTRYTPDYELTSNVVNICGQCPGCTVVCPTQVPIKQMAEFVIRKVQVWKKERTKLDS